jgi:hypothetical protein
MLLNKTLRKTARYARNTKPCPPETNPGTLRTEAFLKALIQALSQITSSRTGRKLTIPADSNWEFEGSGTRCAMLVPEAYPFT